MEINVYPDFDRFRFEVRTKNGRVVAHSAQTYANRRNALAAAKLIASSKIRVVAE